MVERHKLFSTVHRCTSNKLVGKWYVDPVDSLYKHCLTGFLASNAAIPDVHPSTSLGYTDAFYAQKSDYHVQGFNITWAAENTTILAQDTFTVGDTSGSVVGLPGTHLTVSEVGKLYIFYQTEGTDITLFKRDMAGGQQTRELLPIPDT